MAIQGPRRPAKDCLSEFRGEAAARKNFFLVASSRYKKANRIMNFPVKPDKNTDFPGFSLFLQLTPTFKILYSDPWFVLVSKPHGMATHPGRGILIPSAMETLRNHLGTWVYPVHRLDQATSGVLLFGLSPEAARAGQALFQSKEIRKTYIALVRGTLPSAGTINSTLDQKPAMTTWQGIQTFETPWPSAHHATSRYTLLLLRPVTGRTHQLRRHMHRISHPIIGDSRYGDGFHNRLMEQTAGKKRLCLHSLELSGLHPVTHEPIVWRDDDAIKLIKDEIDFTLCD